MCDSVDLDGITPSRSTGIPSSFYVQFYQGCWIQSTSQQLTKASNPTPSGRLKYSYRPQSFCGVCHHQREPCRAQKPVHHHHCQKMYHLLLTIIRKFCRRTSHVPSH